MKRYNQSEAIEKRERLLTERQQRANAIINSIVKKALAKQRKTYIYILAASIVISFLLGALTRYIRF